ncbi:metallophosphoesterase, partial [Staphylococcus pasteuri]
MKFAIITDVHGNFDALETVLDDIDSREDIEKIYNLGDNIGIGHETNKVLDHIFDRDDMEMIAGNHDEAIMSVVNGTPYPEDLKDKFYEHHQWIASHLDEEYYEELNQLPRFIEKEICGKKVLFIH